MHLQRETLRGNRRFYSTQRVVGSLRALLTKRDRSSWDRMLERGWLWRYARMWRKDAGNRAHERMLAQLRPRPRVRVEPSATEDSQEARATDRAPV